MTTKENASRAKQDLSLPRWGTSYIEGRQRRPCSLVVQTHVALDRPSPNSALPFTSCGTLNM